LRRGLSRCFCREGDFERYQCPQQLRTKNMSLVRPPNVEEWLARQARGLASGLNPLFHGTRYLSSILSDGYLKPTGNPGAVRFSRSPDAAAYWAMGDRDDDEGRGAVLVFDRDRLNVKYRLELTDDSLYIAEQEELILWRDVSLGVGLIGIISEPFRIRPREIRYDVWHRRTHGVGVIPWEPTKRISSRIYDLPRHELRLLTRKPPKSKQQVRQQR
jgi:hypothetical protein